MKPIPWDKIQPFNGSQPRGFEKLCVELAHSETPSDTTRFVEMALTHDGGIECFWEFKNGDKWGWQAKYKLDKIDWGEITKSVKTALDKHPELIRYYVCIPRSPSHQMESDWKRNVAEWKTLAKSKTGREVEFIWWNNGELTRRLNKPENIHLRRYWFNELVLDDDWFKKQLEISVDVSKPRYDPALNIDPEVADELERVGKTDKYINGIKAYAEGIKIGQRRLQRSIYQNPDQEDPSLEIPIDEIQNLLGIVLEQFTELEADPIGVPTLQEVSEAVQDAITAFDKYMKCLSQRSKEYGKKHEGEQRDPFWERRLQVSPTLSLLESVGDRVENKRLMIMSGDAGMGKTHLLCDVAQKRIDDGLPTVLLLGQRFTNTDEPWSQARERLGLVGMTIDKFVGALEAAAQRKKRRAILMIDAINEGKGTEIWPAELTAFLGHFEKSPWIAVVLSVRSKYEDVLIDEEIRERATQVIHKGFEGIEYEAVQKCFSHYKLDLSSAPTLHPEFRNPLFLKTVCKELSKKGAKRLPRGIQGTSKIFNLYLDDVNKRLSSKLKCNPSINYVWVALRKFAQRMIDDNKRWLDVETAEETVNALLPGRTYEDSLYNGLLSEDLLIEDLSIEENKIVYISYERLADHIIAKFLLDEHFNPNEPEAAFAENGGLAFLLDKKREHQLEQLIEAFSTQIPERTSKEGKGSKELLEIVPSLIEYWGAPEAFRQSIVWREPSAVSDATLDILNKSIKTQSDEEDMWDMFLTVATIPNHPYNAYFLHEQLSRLTMAERDAWWSTYLYKPWDSQGPAYRLVDWVLKRLPNTKLEEEVVELASIALAWMLTTSNRFLRDRATKALISLLTGRLDTLHKILSKFANLSDSYVNERLHDRMTKALFSLITGRFKEFLNIFKKRPADVNDPYIMERLYAVAYGVAMRSHDVERVGEVAQWVYDNVFADDKPPTHILLRDYARGVVERALYLGAKINVDRELIEPPYKSEFPYIPTKEEIEEFTADWKQASYDKGDIEWSRNKIRKSALGDHLDGDFSHYVIGTNINKFSEDWSSLRLSEAERSLAEAVMEIPENPPRFDLGQIQRYIFKRVFDLGWTTERFGEFDRSVKQQGRAAAKEERIGKKYQWIAYHEIMAYISDHFQYLEGYDRIGKYNGPWRDRIRDIDPSVTLRSNKGGTSWNTHKLSWWAQEMYAEWNEADTHADWLEHKDDIPKIEKLMKVRDHKKVDWLNLYGSFLWRQTCPTEIEASDVDRRELWLSFMGCFVRNSEVDEFMNWANWFDPSKSSAETPLEIYDAFFGEYGWSPAFKSKYAQKQDWIKLHSTCPVSVLMAASECSYGYREFDCSVDRNERTALYLPHFDLIEKLKLKWEGRDAELVDTNGKRAVYDPTADSEGPTSLLFREDLLRRYLEENGLTLCWVIRGEKTILYRHRKIFNLEADDPIRRVIAGGFVLEDNEPRGDLEFYYPLRRPKKERTVIDIPDT